MRPYSTTIEDTIIKAIDQLAYEKNLALKTELIYPRVEQLLSPYNKARLHQMGKLLDLDPSIIVEDWVFRHIRQIQDKFHRTFTTDDKNTASPLRTIGVGESNINWLW